MASRANLRTCAGVILGQLSRRFRVDCRLTGSYEVVGVKSPLHSSWSCAGHFECNRLVGVEKVTSISEMRFGRSMLERSDPAHALLDSDRRRPADHDGATRPLRSAVLDR